MIYYNQRWLRKRPLTWFLKNIGGIAIWPFIWFYVEKERIPNRLLIHELEHHKQQKRALWIGYFIRYYFEYFRNCAKGMNSKQAYQNISYEKAARKVADGR